MTAPLTAERRAAIEGKLSLLDAGGMTASASMLRDLIAEIDRLTAERDAAVAAAVMAERESLARSFEIAAINMDRQRGAALHEFAAAIRSRPAPAPAPAAEGRTP